MINEYGDSSANIITDNKKNIISQIDNKIYNIKLLLLDYRKIEKKSMLTNKQLKIVMFILLFLFICVILCIAYGVLYNKYWYIGSVIFFIFILISSYKLQKYYKINNYFKKYLNDNIEHRKSFEIQIKELIEKSNSYIYKILIILVVITIIIIILGYVYNNMIFISLIPIVGSFIYAFYKLYANNSNININTKIYNKKVIENKNNQRMLDFYINTKNYKFNNPSLNTKVIVVDLPPSL